MAGNFSRDIRSFYRPQLLMESQSHSDAAKEKVMLPPPPGTFKDREDLLRHVRDFGANQGYVVTIKKSRKDRRVILGCDRGGVYRNRRKMEESKRKRKSHSRLINCPFEAIGKKEDDVWVLTIKHAEHNHEPLKDISEHPYCRRFTEEEVRQIKQLSEAGAKPRQVLKALKQSNPELQSTPRHLYNLKAKIRQGHLSEKSFKSWRPNRSVSVNTSVETLERHNSPLKVPNLIRGKFVDSKACSIIDVVNPATQEVVSQLPLTTYEEFKDAVSAAKQAFPLWKNTPVTTRQRIMFKFHELLRRDIDKLAMNITTEQGKTLNSAKGDVLRGLEVVEHACGMASLQMGKFVPNASNGIDTFCIWEPLGVCVGICPFNFPAMISLWMFPIAVTCGNTFILKSSEKNPGASMILAELAMEAGLPDGVLNVVHGTNEIINHMCDDDDIKAISFVGSNTAGMHVYARAAARGKRVQSNMGAKNHAIVMPDASVSATLDALVAAGFGAAGQKCMALSTAIFVGGSVSWEEELVECAKTLKVNVGTEPGADIGPVITKEAKDRICGLVQSAVENGARLILDGRNILVPGFEHGNFVGATILCDVTTSMECYNEEIFGPVLLCMQADTLEDAMVIINRNKCGNGASIFTTSSAAARHFQNEIEAGLVGINVPVPIPLPFSSFNGSKASAGDLNFCGKAGVQFYTQIKTVAQKWKDLTCRKVSQSAAPASETEITSQGISIVQHPTSESDLPSREVSPAMPSVLEKDLSRQNALLALTPTLVRDLRNPGTLPSVTTPMDRDLSTHVSLRSVPSTSERGSANHGFIPLLGTGMSLSMSETSERMYVPQACEWDESVPLTSRRTTENIAAASEKIYIPPASSQRRESGSAPISDSVCVSTSHGNEIMVSVLNQNETVGPNRNPMSRTLSQRADQNLQPALERIYVPSLRVCESSHSQGAEEEIAAMHPTAESERVHMSMVPSSTSSHTHRNDGMCNMEPTSEEDGLNSYIPAATASQQQRIYSNSHQFLSMNEYLGQEVSLTMPTSQRL